MKFIFIKTIIVKSHYRNRTDFYHTKKNCGALSTELGWLIKLKSAISKVLKQTTEEFPHLKTIRRITGFVMLLLPNFKIKIQIDIGNKKHVWLTKRSIRFTHIDLKNNQSQNRNLQSQIERLVKVTVQNQQE